MNSYADHAKTHRRGTAMIVWLLGCCAPFSSHAFAVAAVSPDQRDQPMVALGAHTLLTQSEGRGVTPALTAAIDTQPSGSALLVLRGGYSSNAQGPSDSYQNHWRQLGRAMPYGNGYGDRFDVTAYLALPARGGPGHTVSMAKPGYPAGEISLPLLEIRHAGSLRDMAQVNRASSAVLTSGSVRTTGPATLIAVWWGDAGVKHMRAEPNNGFQVIESFLQLPDNSGVQCVVAFKQVLAAGDYQVSWADDPAQGAILWLFAFQSQ